MKSTTSKNKRLTSWAIKFECLSIGIIVCLLYYDASNIANQFYCRFMRQTNGRVSSPNHWPTNVRQPWRMTNKFTNRVYIHTHNQIFRCVNMCSLWRPADVNQRCCFLHHFCCCWFIHCPFYCYCWYLSLYCCCRNFHFIVSICT